MGLAFFDCLNQELNRGFIIVKTTSCWLFASLFVVEFVNLISTSTP